MAGRRSRECLAWLADSGRLCPRVSRIEPWSKSLETRPYFILGDLAVNVLAGSVVGLVVAALFGPAWNMLLAMIVAMGLGMAVSMPIALLCGACFGAMELMVPVMTTGMVAGMAVSMLAAEAEVAFGWAARVGAYSGVGVVVATYVANSVIKRRGARWTS